MTRRYQLENYRSMLPLDLRPTPVRAPDDERVHAAFGDGFLTAMALCALVAVTAWLL